MNVTGTDQNPSIRRHRVRTLIAIAAAVVLVGGAITAGALFRAADRPAATAEAATPGALETRILSLVDAGYPAVLASVTSPGGDVENAVAGAGNIETGEEPAIDAEVRIASNTKMFVATVVLQLVDEGLVDLDAPIDTYLPGMITGEGIDGADITVHQLLQQTTGLPEYADRIAADAFGAQKQYISPRDMLDVALSRPAGFAPGERWEYSNTNYLVLGLLIEAVTDRAIAEQIDERIVRPLGLEHTYFPAPGERELRGEHPIGYHADVPGELREFSDMDTSFAWSAGAMVSTPAELNTFMRALLNGELLSGEALATMQTTVPAGDELWPEAEYGLGLQRYPLSCGGVAWGHGGDIPGTQTRNAVAPDGTAVTVAVTALPWAVVSADDEEVLLEQYRIVVEALDETLCDR
nr:serine hydrolase domain-containing protein [Microbacterium hydrocarbonoxydans]